MCVSKLYNRMYVCANWYNSVYVCVQTGVTVCMCVSKLDPSNREGAVCVTNLASLGSARVVRGVSSGLTVAVGQTDCRERVRRQRRRERTATCFESQQGPRGTTRSRYCCHPAPRTAQCGASQWCGVMAQTHISMVWIDGTDSHLSGVE